MNFLYFCRPKDLFMSHQQLNNLDCRILERLSDNARTPFLEIARETGVSGAAIHQRVLKLSATGVIRKFETCIDPSSMGYETCAFVGLSLNNPRDTEKVVDTLSKIPEIVELHYTTGRHEILMKVYARNNAHLMQLLHDRIAVLDAGRTETMISFHEAFRRPFPIICPEQGANE